MFIQDTVYNGSLVGIYSPRKTPHGGTGDPGPDALHPAEMEHKPELGGASVVGVSYLHTQG